MSAHRDSGALWPAPVAFLMMRNDMQFAQGASKQIDKHYFVDVEGFSSFFEFRIVIAERSCDLELIAGIAFAECAIAFFSLVGSSP